MAVLKKRVKSTENNEENGHQIGKKVAPVADRWGRALALIHQYTEPSTPQFSLIHMLFSIHTTTTTTTKNN
jgi:hypothetical protein